MSQTQSCTFTSAKGRKVSYERKMKMDYIVFLDGNLFEVSASTKTRFTDDEAVTFYELFYILQISQGN